MVRVLFFAALRERMGRSVVELDIARELAFDEFIQALARSLAPLDIAPLLAENVRVALNQTLIDARVRIAPGDEVAFLPPVTGG